MKKYIIISLVISVIIILPLFPASAQIDFSKITREEVLSMKYKELMELPLNQLMKLAEIVGVSSDELIEIILNSDVSLASKSKEKTFEAPLSVKVISREEILSSGATNLVEALRLVPGMIIREKTSGNYDFYIRGNDNVPPRNMMLYSENSTVLVMIDGRVVYNYVIGGTFWETFPIDIIDVESIEVVKGPASAMYGPNAVSGVINIITKKIPTNKPKFELNAQGGIPETGIINCMLSAGYKKIRAKISLNFQEYKRFQDEIYIWPDKYKGYKPYNYIDSIFFYAGASRKVKTFSPDDYFPEISLAARRMGGNTFVEYKPKKKINLSFSAGLQKSESITSVLDDSYISYARRKTETGYFQLKAKIKGLETNISYRTGVQNAYAGSDGFKYDLGIINSNVEYKFSRKNENYRLCIIPGIGYQRASFDDVPYTRNKVNRSVLNGKKAAEYLGTNIRIDYSIFNRIRSICSSQNSFYS